MQYMIRKPAIVIVAAGQSSRLGSPKQLLQFNGKSLLQHAVHEALKTNLPVIVVIGANNDLVQTEVTGLEVTIIENKRWQQGMSTSLHCGLMAAQNAERDLDGIIFMVSDQPFVSTLLLDDLLRTQRETGLPIIASDYGDTPGTPVLFHKIFFEELKNLYGDAGAKKLIETHKNLTAAVPFPKGKIDIDTKEDYETLLRE